MSFQNNMGKESYPYKYMSVSHGHSTIGGIEWWLWRRQKGEDSLTSTRPIDGYGDAHQ